MTAARKQVQGAKRGIRLFLSSPFLDMDAERDELVTNIFPELRSICAKRGVVWSEVDLRWGIQEEKIHAKEVLPICLSEIDSCIPFFVGILGERYGSSHSYPEHIVHQYPELAPYMDRSITEIEIRHALSQPSVLSNGFFYFRDPAFLETVAEDELYKYVEQVRGDEVRDLDEARAKELMLDRQSKLAQLKQDIKASGVTCRDGFRDRQELGQWVKRDFIHLINSLFPEEKRADDVERERYEHEVNALNLVNETFIKNSHYFEELDRLVLAEGKSIVVHGMSGLGKSALLSNWMHEKLEEQAEGKSSLQGIAHFVGLTRNSMTALGTVKRLIAEMNGLFALRIDNPIQADLVRDAFLRCLNSVPETEKLLIVIDAINQFEDAADEEFFSWLPLEVPNNVLIVVSSTTNCAPKHDKWKSLEIGPLNREQKEQIINQVLTVMHGKSLEPREHKAIVESVQTNNPLFLRALLEEIRLIGDSRSRLQNELANYLQAETPDVLYEQILSRFERVYDEWIVPGFVKNTLLLLWSSRSGLLYSELKHIWSRIGHKIPDTIWATFMVALEPYLTHRSGPLRIYHMYMRIAVQRRYGRQSQDVSYARGQIINYFQSEIGLENKGRLIDELPWQYIQANEWELLKHQYQDTDFLLAAWNKDAYYVKEVLSTLEQRTLPWENAGIEQVKLPYMYSNVMYNKADYAKEIVLLLAELLADSYPDESLALYSNAEDRYRESNELKTLQHILYKQALILQDRGNFPACMEKLVLQKEICLANDYVDGLQNCLGLEAGVLSSQGRMEEAYELLSKQRELLGRLATFEGRKQYLIRRAEMNRIRFRLDEAAEQLKELEQLCLATGNRDALQECLGEQVWLQFEIIYIGNKEGIDAALRLLDRREAICSEIGHHRGLLQTSLMRSDLMRLKGNYYEARYSEKYQIHMNRQLKNDYLEQQAYGVHAAILFHSEVEIARTSGRFIRHNRCNRALEMLRSRETICKELQLYEELQDTYGMQASILYRGMRNKDGVVEEALEKREKQESICRSIGYTMGLQRALKGKGLIYEYLKNYPESIRTFQQQIEILRECGMENGNQMQYALGNLSKVYIQFYKQEPVKAYLQHAIANLQEQERINALLDNGKGVLFSLLKQAEVLELLHRQEDALVIIDRYLLLSEQNRWENEQRTGEQFRQKLLARMNGIEKAAAAAVNITAQGEPDASPLSEEEEALLERIGRTGHSRGRKLYSGEVEWHVMLKQLKLLEKRGLVLIHVNKYQSMHTKGEYRHLLFQLTDMGRAIYSERWRLIPADSEYDQLASSPYGIKYRYLLAETKDNLTALGYELDVSKDDRLIQLNKEDTGSLLYIALESDTEAVMFHLFEDWSMRGSKQPHSLHVLSTNDEFIYNQVMPRFYKWLFNKYGQLRELQEQYIVQIIPVSFSMNPRPEKLHTHDVLIHAHME